MLTAGFPPVWVGRTLAVLRIMTALLFMAHGTQKILGFPGPLARPMPEIFSLIGVAGLMELVGGFLVAIGLFTRPVAFLLSGEMAFAYFMGHAPDSFFPVVNGGDSSILYCFVFLYLFVAGPGAFAVDNRGAAPASRHA